MRTISLLQVEAYPGLVQHINDGNQLALVGAEGNICHSADFYESCVALKNPK